MSPALRRRLAQTCLWIVTLGLGAVGLRYGLASRPLAYHQQVLAQDFDSLAPGAQRLILALLHGSGAAMLAGAAALGLLLAIPWRRGERWARHATPALALAGLLPLLVVTLRLRQLGAATPWWAVALASGLAVAGWVLGPGARGLPGRDGPAKMPDQHPGDVSR